MQLTGPSESKGAWKNTTLQRFICDAVTEPGIEDVSVMGSAQFGKTEIRLNITGYYMDYEPVPQMGIDPTLDMAKAFSRNRLAKMINDTPCLSGTVAAAYGERKTGNAILHKEYPGGEYTGSGANSPASLSGHPKAVVTADDIDRFPVTTKEGDPLDLGFTRTLGRTRKKKIAFSTPTIKGQSRIEERWNQSDRRIFEVCCPNDKCQHWQRLRFDSDTFKFISEIDDYGNHIVTEAWYECEKCKAKISERARRRLLETMRMRITNPKVKTHAGFHVWAIYNPKVTMNYIATQFLKSKDDPKKFQVFTNTVLGELWEVKALLGKDADELQGKDRIESYTMANSEMLILTCAVDVQDNRLEYQIQGWGVNEESWILSRGVINGSMLRTDTWARLQDEMLRPIEYDNGMLRMLDVICIDTGYRATNVYPRVRDIAKLGIGKANVFGVKGWSGRNGNDVIHRQYQEKRFRIRMIIVDADKTKDLLFQRLDILKPVEGEGYVHFNRSCDSQFFDQLTAEVKISKIVGNRKVQVWKKKKESDANEALDLTCYNLVALKTLTPINWKRLKARFDKKVETLTQSAADGVSAPNDQVTGTKKNNLPRRPKRGSNYNPTKY